MTDLSFSDDAELKKLNEKVLENPEDFEAWDKLVRAAENQEGGLHRNSSPGAIASTRDIYDKLLARFPLFFGYWKKYADLEFSIAGTEAAEMVYERGVASINTSVDIWANYCSFKVDTSHDADVIRELFERGADSVGLDFLAHPFWDKYLDFEERFESQDRIFAILTRIIRIPMHQYARYFERYRGMSSNRSIAELAPDSVVVAYRQEILQSSQKEMSEKEMDAALRNRLDTWHLELFNRTQTETTKRWTYESEIKRPYYHVTDLDDQQLENWRKYLDFEEAEGDYARIKFLYERCLVTTAKYEEYWLRYARWMLAQPGKQEEVRNIYQRASCLYIPISQPTVRLFYANFEEAEGRLYVAADIHDAILDKMPDHIETIVSLANFNRRQYGIESAIETLKGHVDDPASNIHTRGAIVSEWARLVWRISGDAIGARQIFWNRQQAFLESHDFWASWLDFEMQQATPEGEQERIERVRAVFNDVRSKAQLSPDLVKSLSTKYFAFLRDCGGKDAMKDFMQLDKEINGPASIAGVAKEHFGKATAGGSEVDAAYTVQQTGTPVNGSQAAH